MQIDKIITTNRSSFLISLHKTAFITLGLEPYVFEQEKL